MIHGHINLSVERPEVLKGRHRTSETFQFSTKNSKVKTTQLRSILR